MDYTRLICHRIPERSFFFRGHQFPVCARCTGFYISLAIYFIYAYFNYVDYDLNLGKIVKLTKGLSGRDLKEKILKTALHNAIANDEDIITMKHIDYALKSTKVKNNEVKGMFE